MVFHIDPCVPPIFMEHLGKPISVQGKPKPIELRYSQEKDTMPFSYPR